jgi:nitroreductase
MSDELSVFEAIHTKRAIRRFRPDPVLPALVDRVLDAAIRAPSGANQRHWRSVVLRDLAVRARGSARSMARRSARSTPPERLDQATDERQARVLRTAAYLAEHMGEEPPLLILACLENPPEARSAGRVSSLSIYPAVQNPMLAAGALALASCLTTLHVRREAEAKALLGIPDHVDTCALIPLGYPATPFGPLTRRPVDEVRFYDFWGAGSKMT